MNTETMTMREKLAGSRIVYRMFEIFPGFLSWSVIIAPFVLSIFAPRAVAYFILIYVCYWVVQAFWYVRNSLRGYVAMQKWIRTDWSDKLNSEFPSESEEYYYATLMPFAKETERVLVPTIESIVNSDFPAQRKILVLSSEAKLPDGKKVANKLAKKFKNSFWKILVVEHVLCEGEIVGKSSNENFCGRYLLEKCREWGIDPSKVLVTSNDADMSIAKGYVPACVYWLLRQPKRVRNSTILQPIPTDHKNIWDTSVLVSIRVLLGTLWRTAVYFMPSQLTVYANYTMTLDMLRQIDFWDPDIIQEDIRTHSKALFRFGKDFRIVPIHFVTEGEPVIGKNMLDTLWLHYKQVRRWAWGAAEISYIITEGLLKKNKAPKFQVVLFLLAQIRTHLDWVIVAYVPLVGSAILFTINSHIRMETIGRNLPVVLSWLLTGATVFLLVFVFLEFKLLPKPPQNKNSLYHKLFRLLKWVTSPYIGAFLGSLPALHAQTMLMFNKRLAYVVYRKE